MTAVIALQSLITYAVNLADNIMLGSYNETSLSGVALVIQIYFVVQSVATGIGTGVVVMGSQFWGRRDADTVRRITALGLKLAAAFGLVFTLAGLFFPRGIVGIMTNDAAVIGEAVKYLVIISPTFLIFSVTNTLIMSLRSVERTAIGPITSLISLVLNIFLNYILIFGKLGAPELGVRGAAIATLVSRISELAVVVIYICFFEDRLHIRLRDLFSSQRDLLSQFVRVTLPALGSSGLWGVAQAAQTTILGHISAEAIAANSVAGVIFNIISVVAMSSASSACVVVGKEVGENRGEEGMPRIKSVAYTLELLFLAHGLVAGAALFVLRNPIIGLYDLSAETARLAEQFVIVLSLTVVGSAFEYPISGGIIQGGGNTRYVFLVDTAFMWLFTIPFAAMSAFWWNFPPVVTFCFLKADQFLKCIPNLIVCHRFRWVRRLTD